MTEIDDPVAAIELLGDLERARQAPHQYFGPLLHDEDGLVRAGAWCALLRTGDVPREWFDDVVAASRWGGVKEAAFDFFERTFEHGMSARIIEVPDAEDVSRSEIMRATLTMDSDRLIRAESERFLATGRIAILHELALAAERAGGWRKSVPWSIRHIRVAPLEPSGLFRLMSILYFANRADLIERAATLVSKSALHPYLCRLFMAGASLIKRDTRAARRLLDSLSSIKPPRPDIHKHARKLSLQFLGSILDKEGDYTGSYKAYVEFNRLSVDASIDLNALSSISVRYGALAVPDLPADTRRNDFVTTGFPRSGTTLLENALGMHPVIETIEEPPTRSAINSALAGLVAKGVAPTATDYLEARGRYYAELDRRRTKPQATVLIDKQPIRSAEARFLSKLFPDKRYIFSIRHPFDVVLSCLRQNFKPNIAMEHFHTLADAAKLYDFSMSEWFSVYALSDERVHYLRYDKLVEQFEDSARDMLSFMGVPWDSSVLDFASGASDRSARTPSYQKVRQGLSIGVQTYWRNYKFVFDSPEATPLHKWAEFFGYPTS